jgi:hypothetical protein
MLQLGITNNANKRITQHGRNGWETIDLRGPMEGFLAREWERSILNALKARRITLRPSTTKSEPLREVKMLGPSGEAWWETDLPVTSVLQLIALVENP